MAGINIGLHWLEYTVPFTDPAPTIKRLNYYYDNDFAAAEGSLYGYIDMLVGRAGIIVLSDTRRNHHHVILPGRWCGEVGEPIIILLGEILSLKYKITRMDIACDNHNNYPDPRQLRQFCDEGQLVTRFRSRTSIENHKTGSVTNYFGSMKSDRFIRVYDKTKESEGKTMGTRWEIVLRNEYCNQAGEHIYKIGINKTFLGTLYDMVDFRKPTSQNRESRRKQMSWYSEFLAGCEKAEYTRYEPIMTLERMEHWLQKSVSKSLAKLVNGYYGDMEPVYKLIDMGQEKLKK